MRCIIVIALNSLTTTSSTHVAASLSGPNPAVVVRPVVDPACSADDYRKIVGLDPVQAASQPGDQNLHSFLPSLSVDQRPSRGCSAQLPGASALLADLCPTSLATRRGRPTYEWCRVAAIIPIAAAMATSPMPGACTSRGTWGGLRRLNHLLLEACMVRTSANWAECLNAASVPIPQCVDCLVSWTNQGRCASLCSGDDGAAASDACFACTRLDTFAGTAHCIAGNAPAVATQPAQRRSGETPPAPTRLTEPAPGMPAPAGPVAVEAAVSVVAPACSGDDYRRLGAWDPARVGTGTAEELIAAFRTSLQSSNPCLAQVNVMDTVADQVCSASSVESNDREFCRVVAMYQVAARMAGDGMGGSCSSSRDRLRSLDPVALMACLGATIEASLEECIFGRPTEGGDPQQSNRRCFNCLDAWEERDRCRAFCDRTDVSQRCLMCERLYRFASVANCLAGPPAPATVPVAGGHTDACTVRDFQYIATMGFSSRMVGWATTPTSTNWVTLVRLVRAPGVTGTCKSALESILTAPDEMCAAYADDDVFGKCLEATRFRLAAAAASSSAPTGGTNGGPCGGSGVLRDLRNLNVQTYTDCTRGASAYSTCLESQGIDGTCIACLRARWIASPCDHLCGSRREISGSSCSLCRNLHQFGDLGHCIAVPAPLGSSVLAHAAAPMPSVVTIPMSPTVHAAPPPTDVGVTAPPTSGHAAPPPTDVGVTEHRPAAAAPAHRRESPNIEGHPVRPTGERRPSPSAADGPPEPPPVGGASETPDTAGGAAATSDATSTSTKVALVFIALSALLMT